MSAQLLLALAAGIFACSAEAFDQWAVLVAGSKGWANYRHQAGICRAKKLLLDRGFDEDKIITMAYDDVAHSRENPFPGKLFNEPAHKLEDAMDVYEACRPDYTGRNVTAEVFLGVLLGDRQRAEGGKVLKSGRNDNVFVNFVDHGGVGLVCFPRWQVLHAKLLLEALVAMSEKKMFNRLLFYMEACESGSMFKDLLPSNLSISAATSTSPTQQGHGIFCGEEASVNGVNLHTCLGGMFGVGWMRDSEQCEEGEMVQLQVNRTRAWSNLSTVSQYGPSFHNVPLSEFQGPCKRSRSAQQPLPAAQGALVSSRDAELEILRSECKRTGNGAALQAALEERAAAAELRRRLMEEVLGREEEGQRDGQWTWGLLECHEGAVAAFGETCGWSMSRLGLSRTLLQLCRRQLPKDVLLGGIRRACGAPEAALLLV